MSKKNQGPLHAAANLNGRFMQHAERYLFQSKNPTADQTFLRESDAPSPPRHAAAMLQFPDGTIIFVPQTTHRHESDKRPGHAKE